LNIAKRFFDFIFFTNIYAFLTSVLPWIVPDNGAHIDDFIDSSNLEDKLIPYLEARIKHFKENPKLDNDGKY
jgi:hypothetical protein